MEGHMKERRRVYPVEPRKIMQASFATKYVNYLLPALTNISKRTSSDQCIDKEREKIVRYEVDMALALSAEGFAWSHALKHKLQPNYVNSNYVGKSQSYSTDYQNSMHLNKISYLNHEPATKKLKRDPKRREMEAEGSEEEESRRRLTYLRKLIPGGSEMMVDDEILLSELGSYVSCLELQVNVLRSMLQIN